MYYIINRILDGSISFYRENSIVKLSRELGYFYKSDNIFVLNIGEFIPNIPNMVSKSAS